MLYDRVVRELALKVQYGTTATKISVPSSVGGGWEPATFRPPATWYAGMFYENQWFAGEGYYMLSEVPNQKRLAIPNDDANWEFRDGAMYNKKDWVWERLVAAPDAEFRVVYVVLFDTVGGFTSWEIIKLAAMIKTSNGKVVTMGAGNVRIVPDAVIKAILK